VDSLRDDAGMLTENKSIRYEASQLRVIRPLPQANGLEENIQLIWAKLRVDTITDTVYAQSKHVSPISTNANDPFVNNSGPAA